MSEDPERVKCSIMSSFWRKYIILYENYILLFQLFWLVLFSAHVYGRSQLVAICSLLQTIEQNHCPERTLPTKQTGKHGFYPYQIHK